MSFIGKVLAFTFSHAAQPDKPNANFANTAAFKTALDSQATQLQTSVNSLYDALNSITPLSSGSENIGAALIAGVNGTTPAAQIADLKAQINAMVIGQIPSDFISYGMARQAIINGDPQIWQAGTSFANPANNTYTADMYVTQFNLDSGVAPVTLTHSQNTLTSGEFPNVKYSYQLATTGAGSGFGVNASYGVFQRIEFGTSELCGAGRTVTVSFLAKTSITNKRIAVGLKQTYGTGGSPSATEILTPTASTVTVLTANLTKYSYTFTTNTLVGKTFGTANNDYLELGIYNMWGVTTATNNFGGGSAENFGLAGNINFTGLLTNTGSTALQFQPKSYNDELIACQRFCQVIFPQITQSSIGNGTCLTTTRADFVLSHSEMRVTPTITLSALADFNLFIAGITLVSATAITFGLISKASYNITVTVGSGLTQGQACQLLSVSTNAKITLDARL